MAARVSDKFANYAIISAAETVAGTAVYTFLNAGISIHEKIAWIINRIEYVIENLNATVFNNSGDAFIFGFSVTNVPGGLIVGDPSIIDYNRIWREDFGAAASGGWVQQPIVKNLADLPGGGILVPPTPLYLFGQGVGLSTTAKVTARMHYTGVELNTDEYWELVQARRVLVS